LAASRLNSGVKLRRSVVIIHLVRWFDFTT